MGDKSYKKKYIDEIVDKLRPHFPTESDSDLRSRGANIFNRTHRFTKRSGYVQKNTIFANMDNAVKLHVIRDKSEELKVPDLKSLLSSKEQNSTFLTNVSLAAIEVGELDFDPDNIPANLKASEKFRDMFERRNDLILLDLILVVEGVNANKDTFTQEELERGYRTIVGMPLTQEHEPTDIQGVFYDAQLVDLDVIDPSTEEAQTRKAVRAQAVFYKHRFPDEADVIIGRATMGTLRFSMECYFEKAECSECGGVYDTLWDYCDHLWDRFEPYSPANRVLKNIKFVGGSYVRHPAEKNAVLLDFKDYSSESLVAAAASKGNTIYHLEIEDTHFAWSDKYSATQSSDNEGDKSMDFETLLAKYPELIKPEIAKLAKAEAEKMIADMESSSEKEELENTIATLTQANEELTTKVSDLETQISERDALDKAKAYLHTLETEGVDLGSDEEKQKLVALFLKSSDEDAETLMAFLRKTKASDDSESDEGSEESESEASDDEQDDESEASEDDNDSEDDGDQQANAGGGSLPLNGNGDDYRKAVASKYGKHLKGSALDGIAVLAQTFDSDSS